jgi:outer membrane protein assembly factor BamB
MWFRVQDSVSKPVVVERAPLDGKTGRPSGGAPWFRLEEIGKSPNQITDEEAWLARNNFTLPFARLSRDTDPGVLPTKAPVVLPGCNLQKTFRQQDRVFAAFSDGDEYTRYLAAIHPKSGEVLYTLDFVNVTVPHASGRNTMQKVFFAQEDSRRGVIYVCNAAEGYAKESRGRTGYITAIDPKNGKLIWRSNPLVANAKTFLVTDNVVICGYGFTDEPDFLYVLDQETGRELQRIPLKTGPDFIMKRDDRVYVRCYDTDYVFVIRNR